MTVYGSASEALKTVKRGFFVRKSGENGLIKAKALIQGDIYV